MKHASLHGQRLRRFFFTFFVMPPVDCVSLGLQQPCETLDAPLGHGPRAHERRPRIMHHVGVPAMLATTTAGW